MECTSNIKKSILKKSDVLFQRSNSISLGSNVYPMSPQPGGVDTPKKHAVIMDENGVWRPGEQDDNDLTDKRHDIQCSVADRTAGERVSYRLIQQRSLDYGLQSQLTRCHLDKVNDSEEPIDSDAATDSGERCSTLCISPTRQSTVREGEIAGRLLASHSPSEDAVFHLIQSKEDAKPFSLRDVLGHRVPELTDEDEGTSSNMTEQCDDATMCSSHTDVHLD